jgi:hypothetical protein
LDRVLLFDHNPVRDGAVGYHYLVEDLHPSFLLTPTVDTLVSQFLLF